MSQKLKENSINETSIIMQDRRKIKQRINFLQRSLVQLSFLNTRDTVNLERPELYKNLIYSLNKAQKLLKENSLIQQNLRFQD